MSSQEFKRNLSGHKVLGCHPTLFCVVCNMVSLASYYALFSTEDLGRALDPSLGTMQPYQAKQEYECMGAARLDLHQPEYLEACPSKVFLISIRDLARLDGLWTR